MVTEHLLSVRHCTSCQGHKRWVKRDRVLLLRGLQSTGGGTYWPYLHTLDSPRLVSLCHSGLFPLSLPRISTAICPVLKPKGILNTSLSLTKAPQSTFQSCWLTPMYLLTSFLPCHCCSPSPGYHHIPCWTIGLSTVALIQSPHFS